MTLTLPRETLSLSSRHQRYARVRQPPLLLLLPNPRTRFSFVSVFVFVFFFLLLVFLRAHGRLLIRSEFLGQMKLVLENRWEEPPALFVSGSKVNEKSLSSLSLEVSVHRFEVESSELQKLMQFLFLFASYPPLPDWERHKQQKSSSDVTQTLKISRLMIT